MKMPAIISKSISDDYDIIDDTVLVLNKKSLDNIVTSPNTYTISRNENQNNGTQSPVPHEIQKDPNFDPERFYSRVFKVRRNGRVSKKSVNRLFFRFLFTSN